MPNDAGTKMVGQVKSTNDLIRACLFDDGDNPNDAIPVLHGPNATYVFNKTALLKHREAVKNFLSSHETIDNRFKISETFMVEARSILRNALAQLD